jgi:hypothetical protein
LDNVRSIRPWSSNVARAEAMFSDRRTSFRARSVNDRHAILVIGREEFPALILDESAGGYCVLMSEPIALTADARAVLREEETAHVVRIAYVRTAAVHTRIGLERVDSDGATAVAELRHRRIRASATTFAGLFVALLIGWVLYRCGF